MLVCVGLEDREEIVMKSRGPLEIGEIVDDNGNRWVGGGVRQVKGDGRA
jgi:hypothetical protein